MALAAERQNSRSAWPIPCSVRAIEREMRAIIAGAQVMICTTFSSASYHRIESTTQDLADYARDRAKPNTLDAGIRCLSSYSSRVALARFIIVSTSRTSSVSSSTPLAMIETDGDPIAYGVGFPHPLSLGTFPRVLARYWRARRLTLEEAIRK